MPSSRIQDQPEAPQGPAEGLRELRRLGRLLRPEKNPPFAARSSSRAAPWCPTITSSGDPVAKQGYRTCLRSTTPTGIGSLSHRLRPELQQLVSLKDDFLRAETDSEWNLISRTNKKIMKTLKDTSLGKDGYAAWASADPGLHFNTTMNDSTCKASGDIRASNPCSEYMFLDDTACNLASANLLTFYNVEQTLRRRVLRAPLPALTIVLEISVMMAQFPSKAMRSSPTNSARRPRLRQYRRPPDDHGPALTARRPFAVRRADRRDDRHRQRPLPKWRPASTSPLQEERPAHAARDPQPPPRRPRPRA